MHPPALPVTLPLTVNPRRTPILTPDQAAARLAEHWLPILTTPPGAAPCSTAATTATSA